MWPAGLAPAALIHSHRNNMVYPFLSCNICTPVPRRWGSDTPNTISLLCSISIANYSPLPSPLNMQPYIRALPSSHCMSIELSSLFKPFLSDISLRVCVSLGCWSDMQGTRCYVNSCHWLCAHTDLKDLNPVVWSAGCHRLCDAHQCKLSINYVAMGNASCEQHNEPSTVSCCHHNTWCMLFIAVWNF